MSWHPTNGIQFHETLICPCYTDMLSLVATLDVSILGIIGDDSLWPMGRPEKEMKA